MGRVRLTSAHLSLVDVGDGDLIRVGTAPRLEFVDWRYGPKLAGGRPAKGFLSRVLSGPAVAPCGRLRPIRPGSQTSRRRAVAGLPFLESAAVLITSSPRFPWHQNAPPVGTRCLATLGFPGCGSCPSRVWGSRANPVWNLWRRSCPDIGRGPPHPSSCSEPGHEPLELQLASLTVPRRSWMWSAVARSLWLPWLIQVCP